MKYKVIKLWPNSPPIGLVFQTSNEHYYCKFWIHSIPAKVVESNPEFFAPHLFTTEDGCDVYEGEKCVILDTDSGYIYPRENYSDVGLGNYNTYKRFSTQEAAQSYFDSLKSKTIKKEPIRIQWSSKSIVESDEKTAIVDYDINGNIVGFEILL